MVNDKDGRDAREKMAGQMVGNKGIEGLGRWEGRDGRR